MQQHIRALAVLSMALILAAGCSRAAQRQRVSESPPPPPTVAGLVLTPGPGQIGLVWNPASSPGIASVRILRRTDATPSGPTDSAATPIDLGADALSYIDSGLTGGTTYFYEVAAINRNGTGALSREASATPKKAR